MKANAKSLFIFPPTIYPENQYKRGGYVHNFKFEVPHGLISIASHLKEYGYDTTIIDCDPLILKDSQSMKFDSVDTKIREYISQSVQKYNPEFIGISTMFSIQIPYTNKLLTWMHEDFPDKKIVVGGNAATYYEDKLRTEHIDHFVRYQGENAMLDIVRGFKEKLIDGKNLSTDEIPVSDWNLFQMNAPFTQYEFYVSVSRGCYKKCTFCTSPDFWKYRQTRNIEDVKKEIKDLVDKGVEMIGIGDDTFMPKNLYDGGKNFLLEGFDGTTFFAETRIDVMRDSEKSILNEAYKSGLNILFVGAESGSQKILDSMHKQISIDDIITTSESLKKIGFKVYTFWMIGNPGSTKKDDMKTVELIKKMYEDGIHDKIYPHIYRHFRGTEWADEPSVRILDEDFTNWGFTGDYIKSTHEIINPNTGSVVYSKRDMEEVFRLIIQLKDNFEEKQE